MGNEFFAQIYNNMSLKEDTELLEIWAADDHESWSEDAFLAVEMILKERGLGLPPKKVAPNFQAINLVYLDPVKKPLTYDPAEALKIIHVLGKGVYFAIGYAILLTLSELPRLYRTIKAIGINTDMPDKTALVYTIILGILGIAFTYFFYFLIFKYSAVIIKILFTMELGSRSKLKKGL